VRIPYLPARAKTPLPSLGGSFIRPRPILAVRITGLGRTRLLDGLLDSGSDDTVFEDGLALALGINLNQAEERLVGLVGRSQPVRCRYASVQLRITDGIQETYDWPAVVGFVAAPLRYALLGYAGFLQFFDTQCRGSDQETILLPNALFPGTRI